MEPRENDLRNLLFLVLLRDDIAAKDFEPAIARPNFFPEIGGAVTPLLIRGIAGGAVVTAIKRQELGCGTVELRRHHHGHVADREMHEWPIGETQQRFRGALTFRPR